MTNGIDDDDYIIALIWAAEQEEIDFFFLFLKSNFDIIVIETFQYNG